MPTLDNHLPNLPNEGSIPFIQTGLRYGLIGGAALIVYNLLSFLVFIPTGGTLLLISGVLSLAIYIGTAALVIKYHRDDELQGYITLGRCVGLGTITIIIATIISSIFAYVYMNYIDPSIVDEMLEVSMSMFESLLDEDEYKQAIDSAKEQQEGLLGGLVQPIFFSVFTGLVLSTIVGLIMRRNPPQG
ncbi:MAG: DUF4199 domain-containing protein [Bacteroidota bacterium]